MRGSWARTFRKLSAIAGACWVVERQGTSHVLAQLDIHILVGDRHGEGQMTRSKWCSQRGLHWEFRMAVGLFGRR